jgi:hypothetical protein|eukprot:SAG25_NODE_16_length_24288_cov_31.926950_28_plen_63_part_00
MATGCLELQAKLGSQEDRAASSGDRLVELQNVRMVALLWLVCAANARTRLTLKFVPTTTTGK